MSKRIGHLDPFCIVLKDVNNASPKQIAENTSIYSLMKIVGFGMNTKNKSQDQKNALYKLQHARLIQNQA